VIAKGLLIVCQVSERDQYVVNVALKSVNAKVEDLPHMVDDVYSSA
jgi:hypothetical protein